jgi:RNA polymerase sigma-70 factor (ECF subfamily)
MTDKREFERIFRQYYGGMFRLARKMLGDDQESKDVVSDVFTQLLNSHTDLHSDTLQSYLLTSVRNRCLNLLVHKQREQAAIVDLRTGENDNTEQEQLDMLHRYIDDHMPEMTQRILRLRYQQGLKYREIADELKVSEVTVFHHLSQSLKELKDYFKSLGYGIK